MSLVTILGLTTIGSIGSTSVTNSTVNDDYTVDEEKRNDVLKTTLIGGGLTTTTAVADNHKLDDIKNRTQDCTEAAEITIRYIQSLGNNELVEALIALGELEKIPKESNIKSI